MFHRSEEHINDRHTRNNDPEPDIRGHVEMLLEIDDAHHGNEYDAEDVPNGVAGSHGNVLQHMGKGGGVVRRDVTENGTPRGNKPEELL